MVSFLEIYDYALPYIERVIPPEKMEFLVPALIAFFVSIAVLYIFRTYFIIILHKLAKKSKNQIDDYLIDSIKSIKSPFYIYISFYIAAHFFSPTGVFQRVINALLIVFIIYYVGKFLQTLINDYTEKEIDKRQKENKFENTSMIRVMGKLIIMIIWFLGFLLLLSNLGINITPLIAGLGVGGIAIAFALQNILEDIFSSFSIYFDKPFKEGDFIIVGSDMGVVKHIGIKTTRIQTLQGQELVVSNRELTSTRINNYKRMDKRRVQFNFGVTYETSNKKLKEALEIVGKIAKEMKEVTLDRVHFYEFGSSSLNFEVVYYIPTSDYNKYMDVQQDFNLRIKEAFEKAKIEMAFPTQTLYLKKD